MKSKVANLVKFLGLNLFALSFGHLSVFAENPNPVDVPAVGCLYDELNADNAHPHNPNNGLGFVKLINDDSMVHKQKANGIVSYLDFTQEFEGLKKEGSAQLAKANPKFTDTHANFKIRVKFTPVNPIDKNEPRGTFDLLIYSGPQGPGGGGSSTIHTTPEEGVTYSKVNYGNVGDGAITIDCKTGLYPKDFNANAYSLAPLKK